MLGYCASCARGGALRKCSNLLGRLAGWLFSGAQYGVGVQGERKEREGCEAGRRRGAAAAALTVQQRGASITEWNCEACERSMRGENAQKGGARGGKRPKGGGGVGTTRCAQIRCRRQKQRQQAGDGTERQLRGVKLQTGNTERPSSHGY